jgi:hypothetical protein
MQRTFHKWKLGEEVNTKCHKITSHFANYHQTQAELVKTYFYKEPERSIIYIHCSGVVDRFNVVLVVEIYNSLVPEQI